ncbi:cardiolipin synthase [Acetatifactor aquisgranensis]|uniref:cardiolipin synthase n=1 Tax=Acetatifactor aquisgranensis TaxID=2941233 RepID=UPI002041F958|nr:cardiolipin synthase [Acetatifactor aquisgranensis]
MGIGEKVNQMLGRLKTAIYGRFAMILLGFLAQLILLAVGYFFLRNYSYLFYVLFLAISAIVVIYIYNAPGNPDLKLSWMLPIAILPVFGAIFYMTIVMQPGTTVLYDRLMTLSENTKKYVVPRGDTRDKLRTESPHMGQLAHYLEKYDNSPVYDNTQMKYYSLGDSQFVDMVEELKKAEKYIFMEFFIVSGGQMLGTVLDILKEKAKQGVEVRFMYDGTNVLWNLPGFFPDMLEAEGIRCKMFAPIRPIFSTHYNNRDHRKILVIDGKVAFTGGINLADEYINEKERFGHWKDVGAMISGDAVERFTYMFLEMWDVDEKEPEAYGKYVLPPEASLSSDGYVIPYSVCPLGSERVGQMVYLEILNTAHTYVHIMTPYLIPDYQLLTAMTYAVKRGVEVVILMPHIPDKKYAFLLAKTYYNQLLEAGVRICEYEPGFVHAKVFISDDVKAVVGTVNLDYRSLFHHFECGVVLYRNSQIGVMERDFQDTLEKCIEVKVEDYQKLRLRDRAIGRIMRLVAPLM